MTTAKNLAIDRLRRDSNFLRKQTEIVAEIEPHESPVEVNDDEFQDSQLRLMFACCHPTLPPESQSALALKTLCGFSPAEIARAFLISEAAVSKRLTRARQRIQKEGIPFEIPTGPDLPLRLDGVLEILYLLFNEGHKASYGEEIIRTEICEEAIRLGMILGIHPAGDEPRTHALLALMCLTAARLPARIDAKGNLVRLEDQDRTLWDPQLVQTGMHHLSKSGKGEQVGEYHLQAGIAACHAAANVDSETDWNRILTLYNQLAELKPSPIVTLNRAVALSRVRGPRQAITELEESGYSEKMDGYYLFHAVMGDFHLKLKETEKAAIHFRKAFDLTDTRPEREFIARKLEACL